MHQFLKQRQVERLGTCASARFAQLIEVCGNGIPGRPQQVSRDQTQLVPEEEFAAVLLGLVLLDPVLVIGDPGEEGIGELPNFSGFAWGLVLEKRLAQGKVSGEVVSRLVEPCSQVRPMQVESDPVPFERRSERP